MDVEFLNIVDSLSSAHLTERYASVIGTMVRGDVCEDIVHGLLLAHLSDSQSAFYRTQFPKDVLSNILLYYAVKPDGPYLTSRSIARSYYQICMEECLPEDLEPFPLSFLPDTTAYDDRYLTSGTIGLVAASRRVLCFLLEVREECERTRHFAAFSDDELATLFDDYVLFLLILKSPKVHERVKRISDRKLITAGAFEGGLPPIVPPSLLVQAIWFSHMLQSDEYRLFMDNSCVRHLCSMPTNTWSALQTLSKEIWDVECDKLRNTPEFDSLKLALLQSYTPAMFLADQDWIVEFVKFTRGTDVFSEEFLRKAHLGYQRMLSLKYNDHQGLSEYEDELERMHFAPCPTVDLLWHTHLLFPANYIQELKFLLNGFAPRHKLLDSRDRNQRFMNDREFKEDRLWQKAFGESLFEYATGV